MACTSIDCPSCNRRIELALKPPLSSIPLSKNHDPETYDIKYYSLLDILFVHEELIKENKRLKEALLAETFKFRSSYGDY